MFYPVHRVPRIMIKRFIKCTHCDTQDKSLEFVHIQPFSCKNGDILCPDKSRQNRDSTFPPVTTLVLLLYVWKNATVPPGTFLAVFVKSCTNRTVYSNQKYLCLIQ